MSTINSKNVQVGTSGTAAQNFTLYQPATPDGTVRLGVGNSGATTGDVVTVNSAGVTVTGTLTATTLSGSLGAATATSLTVNGNNISAVNSLGFRNRIINGNMVIDQRNAGASVTPANGAYTLDRWAANQFASASKFSVQQSSVAPAGFTNSLLVTSLSAYSIAVGDLYSVYQSIEGFNVADLGWGAAGAQTVTLSFWVRSSLTGTFGGAFQNDAGDRAYPFTYTISVANTWEQKTVTVAGDTTGTWLKTNGAGITIKFGLGVGSNRSSTAGAWAAGNFSSATGATSVVGTNGATFYITGVQLEAGSVATPFERRDYGRELMMCQRYYEKSFAIATAPVTNAGVNTGEYVGPSNTTIGNSYAGSVFFKVTKRAAPTVTLFNRANASNNWQWYTSAGGITNGGIAGNANENGFYAELQGSSTATVAIGHWTASIEL